MISARRGCGLGSARRLALTRALVMLLAAGPQLALADPAAPTSTADDAAAPEARANEPFRDGVRRYQEGDLQGAADAFALAYEQSHDFRLLYNLAQVQEELHDYAQALRSLELYLALGSAPGNTAAGNTAAGNTAPGNVAPIAAERREEVARTQAQLAQRAASLRVTANVAGAQLWLDGVPAGGLPSEPTWLNPGAHHLLVTHEGRAPTLQTIVLQPGEQRLIDVTLRVPPPGLAPSAPSSADASEPGGRTPLWIGMGATGASAALAVGFALLTRNADARLERELSNYPADAEALDAARSRVATLAAVTDVCIGASIVAAGLSLYFALGPADGDDAPLGNVQLEIAPGSSSVAFESTF
jgi:hypothetical protein